MTCHRQILADYYACEVIAERDAFVSQHFSKDFVWHAGEPWGHGSDLASWQSEVAIPLFSALSDARYEVHILFAGSAMNNPDGSGDGTQWATGSGYLHGKFLNDWMGFRATNQNIRIRFADFFRLENDCIVECYSQIDIIDFLQQIGCDPLPLSNGERFIYPAPTGLNGVIMNPQDDIETMRTFKLLHKMLFDGLNTFDGEGLESMSMEDYFHPNLKWYGPGGIGACMSFKEFQERHQAPWLIAFPDRKVLGLDNLICDGPICGEAWFQSVEATHSGPYLGVPATGKTVKVSGIDYWLRQDDVFTENWIFIDFVELFDQMDYNLLEHARSLQS